MADRFLDLLDDLSPSVRDAFVEAIEDIKSEAQIAVIAEYIKSGDIDGAIDALNLDTAFFAPLYASMAAVYMQGGRAGLAQLPPIPEPNGPGRVVIRFDGRNPRAEAWIKDYSSRLVVEIVEDQVQGLRRVIRDGMEAGNNPRTTALDIVGRINRATGRREGGIVGLTSQQMSWVQNARAELESGDPARMESYFGRRARDKRFDRTVRKAIDKGERIAAADVRRIVERYEMKLLKYRGDVIGRTETLRSLNAAKHEGLMQLVERGKVRADQIKRVWDATGDSRTRDSHRAMEGQTVDLDQPFTTPSGFKMMWPGDPNGPPEESIQCRCVTAIRIDFMADVA